jgi:hypothetical protein
MEWAVGRSLPTLELMVFGACIRFSTRRSLSAYGNHSVRFDGLTEGRCHVTLLFVVRRCVRLNLISLVRLSLCSSSSLRVGCSVCVDLICVRVLSRAADHKSTYERCLPCFVVITAKLARWCPTHETGMGLAIVVAVGC